MSVFSKIRDYIFKKSYGNGHWTTSSGLPATGYNQRGLPAKSKSNLVNAVNSIVYSAIEINANAFADVGWRVFRKLPSGEIIDESQSPEAVLLRSANPFMEGATLNYLISAWKDSAGCGFWWIRKREGTEIPESIWPLSPASLTPMITQGSVEIQSYRYSVSGRIFDIPAKDVIRFYNPGLVDPFLQTQSPLFAMWQEKGLWDEESKNALALIQNHARPDAIVSPKNSEGQLGQKERERFERELENKFKGAGAGGVLFANTELNYNPLAFTSKDAELLARKGVTKTDILNAFQVPGALFESQGINRATLQTAMIQHGTYAIKPRIKAFKDTLNEKYFPMFGRDLQIEFDNPVPIDRIEEAKLEEMDLKNAVITINEVRNKRGREPVPWGDEPYIPINLIQPTQRLEITGGTSDVKELQKQNVKTIADAYEGFIDYRSGHIDYAGLARLTRSAGISQERLDNWTKEIPQMKKCQTICCSPNKEELEKFKALNSIPPSKPLEKVFRDIFSDQEDEILKALKKSAKGFDGINIKAFPDDATGFINAINLAQWEEETAKRVRPQITIDTSKGVDKTVNSILKENPKFEISPDDFMASKKTEEAILRQVIPLSESTVATTSTSLKGAVKALKVELLEGIIDQGDALPAMVKRVQAIFKNAELHRARAIAITESNKAFNNGTLLSAKQSNVVKAMKWILSPEPCIICRTIAGLEPGIPGTPEVAIGEKFTNTDKLFDDIEHPPAHVNCECTLGVVLIDF